MIFDKALTDFSYIVGYKFVDFAPLGVILQSMITRNKQYRVRQDLVSQPEAESILAPHLELFRSLCDGSWAWVQGRLDAETRATFDPATIAAMMYDRLKLLVLQNFAGIAGVQVQKQGRMVLLTFQRKLVLRFKQFNHKLHSKNVSTNRQEEIYCQQLEIEGVAGRPTCVTLGWVLDAARLSIQSMYITCPIGWSRNKWSIAVKRPGDENLLSFPISPSPVGDQDGAQVIVVPRPQRKTADDAKDA